MNLFRKTTFNASNEVTCEPATKVASKSKARIFVEPLIFKNTIAAFLAIGLLLVTSWFAPSALAKSHDVEKFAADRVIVRFREDAQEDKRSLARSDVHSSHSHKIKLVPGMEILSLEGGVSVEEAIQSLKNDPSVLYAEPDYIVTSMAVPNDPQYYLQWAFQNIKAPQAWDSGYQNAPQSVVAVIDTGIDSTHPDLRDNMWINPGEIAGDRIDNDNNGYIDDVNGWDFAYSDSNPMDVDGHGTHVAGIIGATGDNAVGVIGTMWRVKLMALKFLDDTGSGSTGNAIKAIQYATKMKVKVSNNSWGGSGYSQALKDAIEASKSVGHIFVAAAGNNAGNNDSTPNYPAAYTNDNIIAVASITETDGISSFSNYGASSVDLGAPGSGIFSTYPVLSGGYKSISGTSMASPFVAGAAAMLYSQRPWWRYSAVRNTILKTVRPIGSLAGKTVTGGTLNVAAAVQSAASTPTPNQPGFLPPIQQQVYVVDYGVRYGYENEWAGYRNGKQNLSLIKVIMTAPELSPDLGMEISCRAWGGAVSAWRSASDWCGPGGRARITGFGVRLTGAMAANYSVVYYCNIYGLGDKGPYKDGATCGSLTANYVNPFLAYQIDAIKVYVVRK